MDSTTALQQGEGCDSPDPEVQQVGQSRQELHKERREQEDHRRADHAKAKTRREDYEAYMNVMDVEIAEMDRKIEELLRKRIRDLNAVRKREHSNREAEAEYQVRLNRADEAEYQVQMGIADRNLEAIARCEAVLAKHEPVFVKSRELVDKVGKAADQAMDGVIAHVRGKEREREREREREAKGGTCVLTDGDVGRQCRQTS
eukprot:COSAG06_NODE_2989_length_5984_cov_4.027698_6_plen_202_part_00